MAYLEVTTIYLPSHAKTGNMSNIPFYRRNAEQAFVLARNATTESERAKYLLIAQGWIDRADGEEALPTRPNAQRHTAQPSVQQQQQQQPDKKEE